MGSSTSTGPGTPADVHVDDHGPRHDPTGVAEIVCFTVRLPATQHAKLDQVARSMDRPMAWVVRRALVEYVERNDS